MARRAREDGVRTPVTAAVVKVLEQARRWNPGIGNAPLLLAPKSPSVCVSHSLTRDWWNRAIARAGLEPQRDRGWQSLRRKFASDLMNQPLKVLSELGGWKTVQTVHQCYQRADEDRLWKALGDRRQVGSRPVWREQKAGVRPAEIP